MIVGSSFWRSVYHWRNSISRLPYIFQINTCFISLLRTFIVWFWFLISLQSWGSFKGPVVVLSQLGHQFNVRVWGYGAAKVRPLWQCLGTSRCVPSYSWGTSGVSDWTRIDHIQGMHFKHYYISIALCCWILRILNILWILISYWICDLEILSSILYVPLLPYE